MKQLPLRDNTPWSLGGLVVKNIFSLIEIIMTIVIVGVFGAILITTMSPTITGSAPKQLTMLKQNYSLRSVMENIIVEYAKPASTLAALNTSIGVASYDQDNAYGVYRVEFNDFVEFDSSNNAVADTSGTNSILQVTISQNSSVGSTNNETLTRLFFEK